MGDIDVLQLGIAELEEAYRSRDLSPVEVAGQFLERIDQLDGELHAFQSVTRELATAQAAEAERRFASGEPTPALLGIPVSIKDAFHVRGHVTTLGSLLYKDHVAKTDSGVARRIRASGAVITGKTNTAEFGQSATTDNLLGPDTTNPWDTSRTPGGSSGGAAASVAAGLSTAAIGSDGGGSIRIPAAFTGTFGIKPSAGLVRDERGFRAMSDFVCPGPLTKSVADARRVLGVLADTTYERRPIDKPMRIAYAPQPEDHPVDPGIADAVASVATALEGMGHHIDQVRLPIDGWDEIFGPLVLDDEHRERGHLLADYGQQLTKYERSALRAALQLDPETALRAEHEHPKFQARVHALFEEYDVVLTPATAVPAFPLNDRPTTVAGENVDKLWGAYPFAVPFNVAGTPAASVPCGLVDGLPVAAQLVARYGNEARLLDICELVEDAIGFGSQQLVQRWAMTSAGT